MQHLPPLPAQLHQDSSSRHSNQAQGSSVLRGGDGRGRRDDGDGDQQQRDDGGVLHDALLQASQQAYQHCARRHSDQASLNRNLNFGDRKVQQICGLIQTLER